MELKNELRDAKLGGGEHLFYRYIEYIMAIGLKIFRTLRIAPRHQSTVCGLTTWFQ